jgi:drug/metabolite transporter (DMT)-like permease
MKGTILQSRPQGLAAAYLAAAIAVLIWGATPAATKLAVLHFDPMIAAILRTVVAALVIAPILLFGRFPLPRSKNDWGLLALASFGGFIGFTLFFSYGVQQTSASHAALINAGIPIFTGIFGAFAERRVPGRLWFAGVGLAITGEVILISLRGGENGDVTLRGDLLCVISSACSGMCYVAGARLSSHLGAISVTFWAVFFAGLILLPFLVWSGLAFEWHAVDFQGWAVMAYLVTFSTIIGFVVWYWALAKGGAVRMGTVQFAMPVVSLGLAVWLFGDQLTVPLLASTAIIIAGIAVARRG